MISFKGYKDIKVTKLWLMPIKWLLDLNVREF